MLEISGKEVTIKPRGLLRFESEVRLKVDQISKKASKFDLESRFLTKI